MRLNGTEFGPVWGASGVQGWFGEGYRHHRWLGPLGPDFTGVTFVAKTTTLDARIGNMPLRPDWTPAETMPACIKVSPGKGFVLNAVGLSGPGAYALLARHRWQEQRAPFFISFMSVAPSCAARLDETERFARMLMEHLPGFSGAFGLQVNFSCPNVGLDPSGLLGEVREALDVLAPLGIPLVPKFNVLLAPEAAVRLGEHPHCAAICVSNTVPYGKMPEDIPWRDLFGRRVYGAKKGDVVPSPLGELGGGGLSGRPLFPLVRRWVNAYKKAGGTTPLNAGGGILHVSDVDRLVDEGLDLRHDSIFVGSVAILRPWRVRSIARHAHQLARS